MHVTRGLESLCHVGTSNKGCPRLLSTVMSGFCNPGHLGRVLSPRTGSHHECLDDISEDQFEIIDGAGRVWTPSPWWLADSHPRRKGVELAVRLAPVVPDMAPRRGEIKGAKLRYHDWSIKPV